MKLKFSPETGLVEGGIECAFATLRTFNTPERETVFDLVDWVTRQFRNYAPSRKSEVKRAGKKIGLFG